MMSPDDFANELESTRRCFATNRTKDIQWRRKQLQVIYLRPTFL